MAEKEKIFVGGAYSVGKESRKFIADRAKIIEDKIIELGYIPSLNLLSNENVHSDKADAATVQFRNNGYFLEVGKKVIASIKKKKLDEIRALRYFENEEIFAVCSMASNIALSELSQSIGAIFELSDVSQGSYMEIGLAVFLHQIPVLALSHESGRHFGTMLTGLNSNLLKTVKYNDDNLESIVETFLMRDVPDKMFNVAAFRLQVARQKKLKELAIEKGFKNVSEFYRHIVESYLDNL